MTCVRRADGKVRCWGTQRSGGSSTTPVELGGDLDAVGLELAAGQLYVVTRDAAVRAGPLQLPAMPALVEVLPPGDAIDVRADGDRAYTLGRTGEVRLLASEAPVLLTNVIALGHPSSAGIDALHRDGKVTTLTARTTTPVAGLTDATELVGTRCARRRTGAISCWGAGKKLLPWKGPDNVVTRIVAGGVTCDLAGSGVACSGANEVGQLGAGPGPDQRLRRIVNLPSKPIAIASGDRSWCAVIDTGELACWGANDGGQLGDGTWIDRTRPVVIPGATSEHPPPQVTEPAVARSATAMDWTDLPDGCKRPTTIRLDDDAVTVASAYANPRSSGLVLWFADFALEPDGYRPGYAITRSTQRALELTLQKGTRPRTIAAIDRGRYRGTSGARRATWKVHHPGGVDPYAADVLIERIDDTWICGTVLDPDDPTQRTPFAARIHAARFR